MVTEKGEQAFQGTFYAARFLLNERDFCFFGEAIAEPKKIKSRAHLKEIKQHKQSLGKQALLLRHQNPVEAAIHSKLNFLGRTRRQFFETRNDQKRGVPLEFQFQISSPSASI